MLQTAQRTAKLKRKKRVPASLGTASAANGSFVTYGPTGEQNAGATG